MRLFKPHKRPHTPKLAFVAPPAAYTASSGKAVEARDIELCARIFSMGKLHHAMTGTGAVAIAAVAAIPGTVVSRVVTSFFLRSHDRASNLSSLRKILPMWMSLEASLLFMMVVAKLQRHRHRPR